MTVLENPGILTTGKVIIHKSRGEPYGAEIDIWASFGLVNSMY